LLIGVTGDFIPAQAVLRLDYLWGVFGYPEAFARPHKALA
jgi:hypothetical protein